MESIIKLFSAVPITTKRKKEVSPILLKRTIKSGFIFAPEVIYNYSANHNDLIKLTEMVENIIGITGEKTNSSFHKSWKKIRDASAEQLVTEQIIHYFTTYGFEQFGIYDEAFIYIPNEKLDIPETKEGIRLVVIKGYTLSELKSKLLNLLKSGIALKEATIGTIIDTSLFLKLNADEIESIRNKEVKVTLYNYLNLIPKNPVEFLRFIIFKSTETTLLIKSSELIDRIKEQKNLGIVKLFSDYEKIHGLNKLAEVFCRFKPIFLAFRTNRELKRIVNKIRRLAKRYHKPLPEDYLNSVTAKIKRGEEIEEETLRKALDKVNTFRKIRLAYALKFRTKNVDAILYKIRNGKSYATEFEFNKRNTAGCILDIVLDTIVKEVHKNVEGKKIFIPNYINYALPTTEKQFTGNFPSGTYITIPKDMLVGIHWENVELQRIDLDLSIVSPETGKIGWDSSYRTKERDILFSGDMTDASQPNGASELFYVQRQRKNAFILFVNYYNYEKDITVPFKVLVAQRKGKIFGQEYMIDSNELISAIHSTINQKQKILGLLVTTTKECRFYFVETYLGRSITASDSEFVENSRKYLFNFYENTINFKDILIKAGADVVDNEKECDINLSPNVLEKDSLLHLIR